VPDDPIVRWENEGGAVVPGASQHDRRQREDARLASQSAERKDGEAVGATVSDGTIDGADDRNVSATCPRSAGQSSYCS
jgi:hypothetical protein